MSALDELLLVDEGDIEQAVLMLLEIEKTLVEGAGAAGLAALIRHREKLPGTESQGAGAVGGQYRPAAAGLPSLSAEWRARAGWRASA